MLEFPPGASSSTDPLPSVVVDVSPRAVEQEDRGPADQKEEKEEESATTVPDPDSLNIASVDVIGPTILSVENTREP